MPCKQYDAYAQRVNSTFFVPICFFYFIYEKLNCLNDEVTHYYV